MILRKIKRKEERLLKFFYNFCHTGIKQSVRQKRGVERALSSVRDFMQLIGKAYSYPTEEKKRVHININNSLDFAVSDFTQHMRPHLSRLLGKIRGLQTEGAGIGDNAHATISHLQDSIGKIVSDIDGTIDQRARRIQWSAHCWSSHFILFYEFYAFKRTDATHCFFKNVFEINCEKWRVI